MKKARFKKQEIGRSIRFTYIFYILIATYLFTTILYDSYIHNIPLYYVLFFIFGKFIGQIYNRTQSLEWNEEKNLIVTHYDRVGIVLLFAFIVYKSFFLDSFVKSGLHPIYFTDAIALITLGTLHTKLRVYAAQIDELAWIQLSSKIKDSE